MRDPAVRVPAKFDPRHEIRIYCQELVREFSASELDLDDLAEIIGQLLGSTNCTGTRPDPDLLSPHRRGTHVLGGGAT